MCSSTVFKTTVIEEQVFHSKRIIIIFPYSFFHKTPMCSIYLREAVCFNGKSRLIQLKSVLSHSDSLDTTTLLWTLGILFPSLKGGSMRPHVKCPAHGQHPTNGDY